MRTCRELLIIMRARSASNFIAHFYPSGTTVDTPEKSTFSSIQFNGCINNIRIFEQALNMAIDDEDGDRARLRRELDHLARLGLTNLRILAGSEGPNGQPYRVSPAMQSAPGEYDERLLDALDFLLYEMDKRNMHAVMVLTNFWEWSGGMAQYVSWHEGSAIPYPRDTVWTDFTAYSSRFYECEQCHKLLKPLPGDCCVYCSYGTEKCPPIQEGNKDCCS